jgi:uncharacterized membrane protein
MTPEQTFPEFKRNAVEPIECLKRGWDLIKDDYWLFVAISLLGMLIGSVAPLGILMGPMMCGVYLALLRKMSGEPVEFGTLFKGFDYFVDGFIAALLHYVPMMIIFAPFYVIMVLAQLAMMASSRNGEPNPAAAIGFLSVVAIGLPIMMILMIILSIGFAFAYPLIVGHRLSGANAVKVSFKAGFANFWRLFGLLLLNGLLGFVGVLCCYVGVIFILPVTFAAMAVAYTQVFGGVPQTPPSPYPPPPPGSFA